MPFGHVEAHQELGIFCSEARSGLKLNLRMAILAFKPQQKNPKYQPSWLHTLTEGTFGLLARGQVMPFLPLFHPVLPVSHS